MERGCELHVCTLLDYSFHVGTPSTVPGAAFAILLYKLYYYMGMSANI